MTAKPLPSLTQDAEKTLRVAVLIRRFVATGGKERYALEVTRRLARVHDVHVFAREWDLQDDCKITFHRVPKFFTKPRILDQLMFSHYTRKLTQGHYDIVHSHERVTDFDVLTIHSPCFRTFITRERRLWRRTFKWASTMISPRQLGWLWLERRQFRCDRRRLFIAVSENVKENIQMNYHCSNECFKLAYPGVAQNATKKKYSDQERAGLRAALGVKRNEVVILFVGTEFKRKGLDALLQAVSLISSSGVKLLVAGGGGGKLDRYKKLASSLGLEEQVVFGGLVQDIDKMYAASDICVLPTLSDPGPMVPIEAMAAGVATVISSSQYAGTAELIKDGEALIIKNPHDSGEIASLVMKLMDPQFRRHLSEKGRKLASQLTWEKTTADTLSAYNRILELKQTAATL